MECYVYVSFVDISIAEGSLCVAGGVSWKMDRSFTHTDDVDKRIPD